MKLSRFTIQLVLIFSAFLVVGGIMALSHSFLGTTAHAYDLDPGSPGPAAPDSSSDPASVSPGSSSDDIGAVCNGRCGEPVGGTGTGGSGGTLSQQCPDGTPQQSVQYCSSNDNSENCHLDYLPCPASTTSWTLYCTGPSDPNNPWQWWEYSNTSPIQYRFVRAGDGICTPPPTVTVNPTWTLYCTGPSDPNNPWQWWQYSDTNPIQYRFVRAGDGACTPPAAVTQGVIQGLALTLDTEGNVTSGVPESGTAITVEGVGTYHPGLAPGAMYPANTYSSGYITNGFYKVDSTDPTGYTVSYQINANGTWVNADTVSVDTATANANTVNIWWRYTPTASPSCPFGQTGTPPNCTYPLCPAGTTGTYPNCTSACTGSSCGNACPAGTTGTPPNCVSGGPNCTPGTPGCPNGVGNPGCTGAGCGTGGGGTTNSISGNLYKDTFNADGSDTVTSGMAGAVISVDGTSAPAGFSLGSYTITVSPSNAHNVTSSVPHGYSVWYGGSGTNASSYTKHATTDTVPTPPDQHIDWLYKGVSVHIEPHTMRVRPTDSFTLSYWANGVNAAKDCTLTGGTFNISKTPTSKGTLAKTSTPSTSINGQTSYTVTCFDDNNSPVTDTATINLIPVQQEI